jgi:hypothetical protein
MFSTSKPLFNNTSSLIIICKVEIGTKELASIEDLQSRWVVPRWEELQMEGTEMKEMGGVVEGMRVVTDGR